MTRQGLSVRGAASPAAVALAAVGLQAQDPGASRLGIRARSGAVDEAVVKRACDVERSVVRTWLMRSTVHLVAAQDVRWMATLCGPMIERRFMNIRWRELGITAGVIERAIPLARELLAGRQLTRHELTAELAGHGVRIAEDGQAATHLLLALSARGVTCRGADRGRENTFALVDDWIPAASAPADPLAELARRYFRAFGPATAADFTTWSGLSSGAAIKAIRDELSEVPLDGGRTGYSLGPAAASGDFRLLPMFDNYMLAYRDRAAMIDPARYHRVFVGGIIKATVVSDGRVIGIWHIHRATKRDRIEVEPFEKFTRTHLRELGRERAELERFFDTTFELRVGEP